MGAVLINRVPAPYSRNKERNDDPMGAQASVLVSGRTKEPGGLKESIAKFSKHQAEVGAALLNISGIGLPADDHLTYPEGRDENDPRPAYDPKDPKNRWPCMVYHAEKGELTVNGPKELKEAYAKDYRDDPYPKPQIEVLAPEIEKKRLKDENDQLRGQMARLEDQQNKLAEALAAAKK